MKILAMDTATAACSVALWQNDQVTHRTFTPMARGHASALLPMIESLLQDAAVTIADLDGFAVSVGPGGFSGLRIALSTARGFAVATKKPVVGITTLEALAAAVGPQDHPVLCALDAKRADLYAQAFSPEGQPLCAPTAALPQDCLGLVSASKLIIAGDSFARLAPQCAERGIEAIESPHSLPDAAFIATLAAEKLQNTPQDIPRPEPLYLRPPDAAIPKNGGRLRP